MAHFYEKLVREYLKITDEFIGEHADVIRDRLNFAAAEVQRERGDIFAINQCLHLAGSLVLYCATPNLNYAIDRVRQIREFFGKDPTTVLTVAMLFFLLRLEPRDEKDRSNKEILGKRFDEMNWLVGEQGIAALGFEDPRKES